MKSIEEQNNNKNVREVNKYYKNKNIYKYNRKEK